MKLSKIAYSVFGAVFAAALITSSPQEAQAHHINKSTAPETSLRPVIRPAIDKKAKTEPPIETVVAKAIEFKTGKFYTPEQIAEFIEKQELTTPIAESYGRDRILAKGGINAVGKQFLLVNPDKGNWALFHHTDNAAKIELVGAGSHYDFYPETYNSVLVADTNEKSSFCANLSKEFDKERELVFAGLNDFSAKNDMIMVHTLAAFDTEDKDHTAIIGRRTSNQSCTALYQLTDIFVDNGFKSNGVKNQNLAVH